MRTKQVLITACLPFVLSSLSFGAAILPGFNTTSDGRNDDGTYTLPSGCTNAASGGTCAGSLVPVGFSMNFLGVVFNSVYVNTNGNVTLDAPLSTFTPFGLTATTRSIIAPFFGDVDTRGLASGITQFGTGTFGGRSAFGVNWINVGYFSSHTDLTNSFQLLLVDRTDTGAGNFDIVFNYDNISWETGDASGGVAGLGGSSARAGFSNGTGNPGTSFELAGSSINGALLNNGVNALTTHDLNSDVLGRYIFFARNGTVTSGVPEPGTLVLVPFAALILWCSRRARA